MSINRISGMLRGQVSLCETVGTNRLDARFPVELAVQASIVLCMNLMADLESRKSICPVILFPNSAADAACTQVRWGR